METPMSRAALPSRNPAWGFWGSAHQNGFDGPMAWEAVSRILSVRFALSAEETRSLLDARFGRHLADELSFVPGGPVSPEAIQAHLEARFAQPRWRGWVIGAIESLRRG
jgi:hypothetical protein